MMNIILIDSDGKPYARTVPYDCTHPFAISKLVIYLDEIGVLPASRVRYAVVLDNGNSFIYENEYLADYSASWVLDRIE